jgi:isopenicillin-N epimerase
MPAMRDEFLLEPGLAFLNHGSFGACPREVLQEQHRWQFEMERNPLEFLSRRSAGLLKDAREQLARYVGARVDDLVFVPNATSAVNMVAQSLVLQPGDEVLASDHEYGACETTWRLHCERQGAHYRRVEIPLPFEPETFVARMLAGVTPRTRLILVSHITSVTALILPVAELCRAARERGVLTLVDGAHAPGQIALDLEALGADFYTGNCHKWMCAPKGSAFFHARPEHHARLQPAVISWGMLNEGSHDASTGSTVLERRLQWQGTRDLSAWLSVPAAIRFQAERDWPAVQARCHAMAIEAMHAMCERTGLQSAAPDASFAQMSLLPVPHQDAQALRRRLFDEHRVEVQVTQHAGRTFVRLSVQGYTGAEEIQRLLDAL